MLSEPLYGVRHTYQFPYIGQYEDLPSFSVYIMSIAISNFDYAWIHQQFVVKKCTITVESSYEEFLCAPRIKFKNW